MSKYQMVIGRGEPVTFPDLDIHDVPAKTDTGAYRSAVHCTKFKVTTREDGTEVLKYSLFTGHPCATESEEVETADFKRVVIANSFGHEEERYEVRLRVKIGPKIFITPFTLANRGKKIYPILLGRKFIRGRFLVDVRDSNINRKMLKERYGIALPEDEEANDED